MKKKIKLSKTSAMHYWKLAYRSALFLLSAYMYIRNKVNHTPSMFGRFENDRSLLTFLWFVFFTEMVLRFFPGDVESMGCRKQFGKNYIPTGAEIPVLQSNRVTLGIAAGWIGFNALFGILYIAGVFDWGIMVLLAMAYSVCDMICILFFCPFQTWWMKNKCCGSCRIYNWDYAMMFTPFIFVRNVYTWSILFVSLALLAHWEILIYRHPERFSESTNAALSCANCTEKLCHHKRQLQRFHKEYMAVIMEKIKEVQSFIEKK